MKIQHALRQPDLQQRVRPAAARRPASRTWSPSSRRAIDRRGRLKQGGVIPISQTLPDVNLDEILSSLDSDTRDYLQLLLNDGAQGIGSQAKGVQLADALRQIEPTAKYARADQRGPGDAAPEPRARRAQLLAADRRARLARHAAVELRRELQRRLLDAGLAGPEPEGDARAAAEHARRDATRRSARSSRWPTSSGRRCRRCAPAPARSGRRCARRARSCARRRR